MAGTGLLANTGDPDNINPVISNVLVTAGETVGGVASNTDHLAMAVDNALPGDTAIVGAVTGTVGDLGQALVDTGKGDAYLVDSVTGATNDLATLTLGENAVLGGTGDPSLVGVSLFSGEQSQGELLTVGLNSGGESLTLEVPLLEGATGGDGNLLGNTLGAVTGALGNAGGTDSNGGLVGGLLGGLGGR